MLNLLRYYLDTFLHPELKDFSNMGFGIEARARRCSKAWQGHLENSCSFQKKAFDLSNSSGSCLILGSGRLLDLATAQIKERFEKITCLDADPGASRFAKKIFGGALASFILTDLSASLTNWTKELEQAINGKKDLACFLRSLTPLNSSPLSKHYDCILSVNLLSQIPIYWRDRVIELLKQKLGINTDEQGDLPEPYKSALAESMLKLEVQHLEMLANSNAKLIILISDLEFNYYTETSPLHQEKAIQTNPTNFFNNWQKLVEDSWLWEIAPIGLEYQDYGVRHLVKGWAFFK